MEVVNSAPNTRQSRPIRKDAQDLSALSENSSEKTEIVRFAPIMKFFKMIKSHARDQFAEKESSY